mmetsp:Transcript_4626/g.13362  ORF Transcript_4626/g.13362 Transcript_4626/m.13362 type:complete len:384 (-) Transcript_4626:232-1383(-)
MRNVKHGSTKKSGSQAAGATNCEDVRIHGGGNAEEGDRRMMAAMTATLMGTIQPSRTKDTASCTSSLASRDGAAALTESDDSNHKEWPGDHRELHRAKRAIATGKQRTARGSASSTISSSSSISSTSVCTDASSLCPHKLREHHLGSAQQHHRMQRRGSTSHAHANGAIPSSPPLTIAFHKPAKKSTGDGQQVGNGGRTTCLHNNAILEQSQSHATAVPPAPVVSPPFQRNDHRPHRVAPVLKNTSTTSNNDNTYNDTPPTMTNQRIPSHQRMHRRRSMDNSVLYSYRSSLLIVSTTPATRQQRRVSIEITTIRTPNNDHQPYCDRNNNSNNNTSYYEDGKSRSTHRTRRGSLTLAGDALNFLPRSNTTVRSSKLRRSYYEKV